MSAPAPRSGSLLRSLAILYYGQWWLVSGAGAIPATDTTFTGALDRFTATAAAADRSAAESRARRIGGSVSDAEGRR